VSDFTPSIFPSVSFNFNNPVGNYNKWS